MCCSQATETKLLPISVTDTIVSVSHPSHGKMYLPDYFNRITITSFLLVKWEKKFTSWGIYLFKVLVTSESFESPLNRSVTVLNTAPVDIQKSAESMFQ